MATFHPGIYSGITPVPNYSKQLSYFELYPQGFNGQVNYNGTNNVRDAGSGIYTEVPPASVPPGTSADFRNVMKMVLPCKGNPSGYGSVRNYGKAEPYTTAEGQYPQGVGARHQNYGLSSLPNEKPNNVPLMPIADFYNPSIPSSLGQPPG